MIETEYRPFIEAKPVWIAKREREMNLTVRFCSAITAGSAFVRLTASTLYRMLVNGKLVSYGPARGPKDFFRVDEVDISKCLHPGENFIVIEVAGYNTNSYYTVEAPSFLQAEVISDGAVLAYTAPDGAFSASVVTERVQRVQRYSFQRPFAEAWRMTSGYTVSTVSLPALSAKLAEQEEKALLPRRVPFATLAKLPCAAVCGEGSFTVVSEAENGWNDCSLRGIGEHLHGYTEDKLEVRLTDDAARYVFKPGAASDRKAGSESLGVGRYLTFKWSGNHSGFLSLRVTCSEPVCIVAMFDEIVCDGDINWRRMGDVCNLVRWELEPDEYELISFECYTMQGVKLVAVSGSATVSDVSLIEYAAPAVARKYGGSDPELKAIWDSAVETYRQNAVDVYTDCPSRERAGWLCDSFFTSRVEKLLTGKSIIERNFLENFLLPESFPGLPDGMLPMCYPADHLNGVFIPNWAMWFVLELREYLGRSGDRAMVDAFRAKLDKLFAFFDNYMNSDGLLEKLPSWVFVEWSHANDLVQDVNYPSNMLYAECLDAYSELYGDCAANERARSMRETIRKQSFDGSFFTDNAVRGGDGKLCPSGERTEVCQYYAFYFGVATPEIYPGLWKALLHDFGPDRRETGKYAEVHYANAFIGNYLRLDLLARYGYTDLVRENIRGYFSKMAEKTGTLWEHDNICASLDHGFASHVAVWLAAGE